MRVQRTYLIHAPASDVIRYVSDPRQLRGWPSAMDYQLTPDDPSEPGRRRYGVSSRTTHGIWIVDVRAVAPNRTVRVEFGREGKPSQGWFRYDLEPVASGTSLRTVGEVRMNPLIRLANALLARRLDVPDPDLDSRVQRWLAANPDP
jgi:uncharacterized protein YndB with AHSA1/START domain